MSGFDSDPAARWTRRALQEILRENGLRLRKSLGQNFLVDPNFLGALARDTGATKSQGVVEIGSGLGNLTDRLSERAGHVWAIEIDRRLHEISRVLLRDRTNITFVNADGAAFESYVDATGPLRIVSSLPYSDWRRLLLSLLSARRAVLSYTFMVQADVYDRLRARPGCREYGPMAALLQATCEIRPIRHAGRELFFPVPRVESRVFELVRKEQADFIALEARIRALFAHRRKKSAAAGGRRVEELTPSELLELARA